MTKMGGKRHVAGQAGRQIPAAWFEPSIHMAYFLIFCQILEERGLPVPRPPVGQARLLPLIDFLPSFEAAGADTNPIVGIDVGLSIPGAAHGAMGLSAMTSATIADAMAAVVRYVPMRNTLFRYVSAGDCQ